MVVEAKKEDIIGGTAQCAAELVAAHRFNEANGRALAFYFGAVTTGTLWRFLRLDARHTENEVSLQCTVENNDTYYLPLKKLLSKLIFAIQSPVEMNKT